MSRSALALLMGLATAAGLAHAPAWRVTTSAAAAASQLRRSRVAAMQESGTKITVRKPGGDSASSEGGDSSSSGAKISVRVRPKGERKAAPEPASAAAVADADMAVTVKVNAPANVTIPAPPPSAPTLETKNLTEADQLLLEGTTKANCTLMLEALQAGANPNVRDPKGRTPLHFIAGLGLAPAAVLLIHFGAQLDVRDGEGLAPMHMAAGYANAQTLRVLVAAGADTEVVGQTQGKPLQIVLQLGEYQLTQFENRTAIQQRLKKKDDKLETLKACVDIFDDIEGVKAEFDWEESLKEVLIMTTLESRDAVAEE